MAADNPLGLDRSDPAAKDDITTINQLTLPVDKPVLVHLSTKDVIHSFGLYEMRVKQDAVPGLDMPVWFIPNRIGDYEIACSQLCGLGHYRMRGFVNIKSRRPTTRSSWRAGGNGDCSSATAWRVTLGRAARRSTTRPNLRRSARAADRRCRAHGQLAGDQFCANATNVIRPPASILRFAADRRGRTRGRGARGVAVRSWGQARHVAYRPHGVRVFEVDHPRRSGTRSSPRERDSGARALTRAAYRHGPVAPLGVRAFFAG